MSKHNRHMPYSSSNGRSSSKSDPKGTKNDNLGQKMNAKMIKKYGKGYEPRVKESDGYTSSQVDNDPNLL